MFKLRGGVHSFLDTGIRVDEPAEVRARREKVKGQLEADKPAELSSIATSDCEVPILLCTDTTHKVLQPGSANFPGKDRGNFARGDNALISPGLLCV